MKPDWKDAPEWANWLVAVENYYYWYENEPFIREGPEGDWWDDPSGGLHMCAGQFDYLKEKRP